MDANCASAGSMTATPAVNRRRSQLENGAVTGDAASSTNIHAQAVRIMSRRRAVT
jgi:hypothetical protein